jgi:glycosyltransferase involved in cell wall biosynthesis
MVSEHASPLAALTGADLVGPSARLAALVTELGARGHRVCVYTRRDDPDLPDVVRFTAGVEVIHVPVGPPGAVSEDELLAVTGEFGRFLAARWAATDAGADGADPRPDPGRTPAHDHAPDVVHAHSWTGGLAALTATASHRIPVVVSYHGLGSTERRQRGSRDSGPDTRVGLERELGQLADAVIADDAEEAEELGRLGVPRGAIHVVPGGVDTARFTPHGPAARRASTGRQRILGIGQPGRHDGFADLVGALRLVPDAELVLIGGPPADQLDHHPDIVELRRLADRIGVTDRVRLLGRVPPEEVPSWYRSADVVACAPRYGPVGSAPLEAMACGVPVVGYAVGGLAESVIDGLTGTVVSIRRVPIGDSPGREVRGLARALRAVLADTVRRMSYASAAVDRVTSRYTWERAADDVERVYADVIASIGRRDRSGGSLSTPQVRG